MSKTENPEKFGKVESKCPDCGYNVHPSGGCAICLNCGYSACG